MRAGRLRHRIHVLRRPDTPAGPRGQRTSDWEVVHEAVPAEVTVKSASEADALGRDASKVVVEVLVRPLPDLTIADRIRWDGGEYEVVGRVPDPRNTQTLVTCELVTR